MRTEDEVERCRTTGICRRQTTNTRNRPGTTRAKAMGDFCFQHPQHTTNPPLARSVKGLETLTLYVYQEGFFQNGKSHRRQDELKELKGFLRNQRSLRMLWVISASSHRQYAVDLCPIVAPFSSIEIFFGMHIRFPGGVLPQCFSKFRDSLVNFKCVGCGMEALPTALRNFSKLQVLVLLRRHHKHKICP